MFLNQRHAATIFFIILWSGLPTKSGLFAETRFDSGFDIDKCRHTVDDRSSRQRSYECLEHYAQFVALPTALERAGAELAAIGFSLSGRTDYQISLCSLEEFRWLSKERDFEVIKRQIDYAATFLGMAHRKLNGLKLGLIDTITICSRGLLDYPNHSPLTLAGATLYVELWEGPWGLQAQSPDDIFQRWNNLDFLVSDVLERRPPILRVFFGDRAGLLWRLINPLSTLRVDIHKKIIDLAVEYLTWIRLMRQGASTSLFGDDGVATTARTFSVLLREMAQHSANSDLTTEIAEFPGEAPGARACVLDQLAQNLRSGRLWSGFSDCSTSRALQVEAQSDVDVENVGVYVGNTHVITVNLQCQKEYKQHLPPIEDAFRRSVRMNRVGVAVDTSDYITVQVQSNFALFGKAVGDALAFCRSLEAS